MSKKIIKEIIKNNEIKEGLLSPFATITSSSKRLKKLENDIRSPFARDADRIINTLAYNRYIDKAQVYTHNKNDHTSRRIEHVIRVSKIARTIGNALNLNLDLIEAISLGHDIGHPPFAHVGEAILNKISISCNEGFFNHNIQSIRHFLVIENNGYGSNLTIQTLDGIMCHNGEIQLKKYYPKNKDIKDVLNEYNESYNKKNNSLIPMTLEGCVVRVSDIIGYIGYDIDDAINLKKLKRNDIPNNITKILGNNNREIINTLVMDIIINSYNKPYIKMSHKIYKAFTELKAFNYKYIYNKAHTKVKLKEYDKMFNYLFNFFLDKINDKTSDIYINFLHNMNKEYINNTSNNRKVIDYLAGMTDGYFIKQYEKHKKD